MCVCVCVRARARAQKLRWHDVELKIDLSLNECALQNNKPHSRCEVARRVPESVHGDAGESKEGSSELIAQGVFHIVKLIAIRVLQKK